MMQYPYFAALSAVLLVAAVSWMVSVIKKDVSFVDSLWSIFFLIAAAVFALGSQPLSFKGILVLTLVGIWSLRLSVYITARNWGMPEDYRYQSIRANNEPGFAFKSLYIVFGLQGVLACLVAVPLLPAISSNNPLTVIDVAAVALWTVGFVFEAGGDYQLARFKSQKDSDGKVLDTGLWRYTRHPNYFGEFCMWWAFYLFAVATGDWWIIISPLLMSFLLLKVSGVAMLEKTITDRRPKYSEYIRRTNAFFPGPRQPSSITDETTS